MANVLVERPRHGGGLKYPRNSELFWRRVPLEDRPSRESPKRPWVTCRKSLNENLAPLRRFLLSRVGTPWDAVYGEICERINRDSAVQLHIWQHLMWEVARHPVEIERYATFVWRRAKFYVDPRTGLLRRMQQASTKRQRRAKRRERDARPDVAWRAGRHYRRIEGVWYAIELVPLPQRGDFVWDAVLRRLVSRIVSAAALDQAYGDAQVYARAKRQLGKRDLRRLGLA